MDTAKSHEQASRSSSGKTEGKPPQSFCDACWRLAQLVSSCPTQPAGRSSRSPLPRYLYQPGHKGWVVLFELVQILWCVLYRILIFFLFFK